MEKTTVMQMPVPMLLIDDDGTILDGISQIISNTFPDIYLITKAYDGHQAIMHMEKQYFPVIITDIKMPNMFKVKKSYKTYDERQKSLYLIQDELIDIEKKGRLIYDGILYPKESISESFKIIYSPNLGMDVFVSLKEETNNLLASFYEREMKNYYEPILKDKEKDKVLTKIQIKK